MDVLASTILGLDLSGADEHNSKLVRYGMQALKFNVNRIKALALCKYIIEHKGIRNSTKQYITVHNGT